jgi:penicillin-binding protein 1C
MSQLEFSFPVAAKTGTSKGYRDNWTLGFSSAVTVAVWVGNFDGKPMIQSSGITGAGPLFHKIMSQVMQGRPAGELRVGSALGDANYSARQICSDSGLLSSADCPHTLTEVFSLGTEPTVQCDLHVRAFIDAREHKLTAPRCPDAKPETFEIYPPAFQSWALNAGRPLLPRELSSRCPEAARYNAALLARRSGDRASSPRLLFPHAGARFILDPALSPEQQSIAIEASTSGDRIRFLLDGRPIAERGAPFRVSWRLTKGEHVLLAETPEGERSEAVRFTVE